MQTPRWLALLYGFVLFFGVLIALPNLFSEEQIKQMPFMPDTRVTLGLDLRGGSYLVLEIDAAQMQRDRLRNVLDGVRTKLRSEQIQPQSVRMVDGAIVATITDGEARGRARPALAELISPISTGPFSAAIEDLEIAEQGETIIVTPSRAALDYNLSNAIDQSLEIIRQRVDEVGVAEPSIQRVGADRIMVQLPGLQDPARLRTLLGTTAKMTFHLVPDGVDMQNPPPGISVLPHYQPSELPIAVYDQVAIDGAHLTDARPGQDPRDRKPVIEFTFNGQGAREFSQITSDNVGRPFAIVLDGKVLTAPVINQHIGNGRGVIFGNFDTQETITLSALLRAGSLPAPLQVIEERTVGPDLGADAIKMGLYTGIIGFILVAVFIFLLYGLWGLIADVALALHTVLTFSALSLLGATLTLPGIAGIILGIGIAVDANILINERIREESRKGVGALAAVDRGFRHAFATIVDANVTAVIATLLLAWFGTGPVRGFAITMLLGIGISMFTEITLVRILMIGVVRRWKMKELRIQPFLSFIPQHTSVRFMNARFFGIGLSIVLSLASLILFFTPGLNYGIDFKGGIQVEISRKGEALDLATLRGQLTALNLGEVALQNVGNEGDVMIRLQRQEGGEDAQTVAINALRVQVEALYPDVSFERVEVVGPKVSGELARNGLIAVILASLAMGLYIWLRFEWYFAIGAIATLILDTTKMVGFFVLFQLDFNLTAIAALLTIVGYSVNDKVVVYDRMRENLRLYKKKSLREIIDMSINQVLVRCIFTSLTTVLAMLPMAIWGGGAVHNFAVPLVVGVVIATSSSMFIAAPILLFLGDWWRHRSGGGRPVEEEVAGSKPAPQAQA